MYMRRSDNRVAGDGRTSIVRANPGRRRASVLVFVVALLGLLFIVGAAFLRSVTFEAKSIAIESKVQAEESLIDTLEVQIFAALERSWLGPEGPYTILNSHALVQPDPIDPKINYIVGPLYGELGGVSPILSSIEPFQNGNGQLEFDTTTQFDLMTVAQAAPLPPTLAPLVPALAVPGQDVDADGNGIADSRVVQLTSTLGLLPPFAFIPPHILDPVAEELNAAGAGTNLGLALRISSNSGMANLNWSHPYLVKNALVDNALDPGGLVTLVNAPYEPRMEEGTLRNGILLPPQVLPASVLHGRPDDPENLGDLVDILFPPGESNSDYRWWAYDTAAAAPTGSWFPRMESEFMDPDTGEYDRRHLVTTISSDDLFIRSDLVTAFGFGTLGNPVGNDPLGIPATYGLDWMGVILSEYDNTVPFPDQYQLDVFHNMQPQFASGALTDYAYDAYPAGLPIDDPRKGRVQLSLAWIEAQLLTLDSQGGPLSGTQGINRIAPDPFARDLESIAAVRLIQDAFTLMLRNQMGGSSFVPVDIPLTAASLTANLIDYADSDDIPTAVEVRGVPGPPPNILDGFPDPAGVITVYGLERQPYITELFTMLVDDGTGTGTIDTSVSVSAIELHNPYNVSISLSLYSLRIDGAPFDLADAGALTLPANGFVVLWNGISDGIFSASAGPSAWQLPFDLPPGQWLLNSNSTVELIRLNGGGQPMDVVVDRFAAGGAGANFGVLVLGGPDQGDSLERDTNITYTASDGTQSRWRVTVPNVGELVNGHTMVTPRWNSHLNVNVRPVQVDFADSGSLTTAFPTTGSLLLLMRHANGDAAIPGSLPFTAWLSGLVANPVNEDAQIDNGRMPVFDVAQSYHWSAGICTTGACPWFDPTTGGLIQGVDGLNAVPWGQYIFDYFTALPLDDPAGLLPLSPKVEEFGARVHGRININTAPWKVLEGLPLIRMDRLPGAFRTQIADTVDPTASTPYNNENWIGPELAQSIVAYRELRSMPANPGGLHVPQSGDYGAASFRGVNDPAATMRRGRGFMSVGELLEVNHADLDLDGFDPGGTGGPGNDLLRSVDRWGGIPGEMGDRVSLWRMDSGVVGRTWSFDSTPMTPGNDPSEDFVSAVALMVSLGDWVTTRSHVFTVYGTVSGNAATNNEIRFQETVDRLPGLLDGTGPERIGERIVEE